MRSITEDSHHAHHHRLFYLIKTEDGHIHHFRAQVEGHHVVTVQGVYYQSLERASHHLKDHAAAESELARLVRDKQAQGYVLQEFEETPENNINVYDQASYHYTGDFPPELDEYQAYVHTGMYLGWLINRDLVSDDFREHLHHEIEAFMKQELTGTKIYESCCDGMLMIEDLSEIANRFSLYYFDFENGQYLQDYDLVLAHGLPSPYHVEDTWDNYYALRAVLDRRFAQWKQGHGL